MKGVWRGQVQRRVGQRVAAAYVRYVPQDDEGRGHSRQRKIGETPQCENFVLQLIALKAVL